MFSKNPCNGYRRKVLLYGINNLQSSEVKDLMNKGKLNNFRSMFGTYAANIHHGNICIPGFDGKSCLINSSLAIAQGWTSILTGTEVDKHLMIKGDLKSSLQRQSTGIKSFLKLGIENELTVTVIGNDGICSKPTGSNTYESVIDAENTCLNSKKKYRYGKFANTSNSTHLFYVDDVLDKGNPFINIIKSIVEFDSDITFMVLDKPDLIQGEKYHNKLYEHDNNLGIIINYLQYEAQKNQEEWLIILTSNHGHHNKKTNLSKFLSNLCGSSTNYTCSNINDVVPFLIKVIKPNNNNNNILTNINNKINNKITHMTTFNLVCHWMGLEVPSTHPYADILHIINLYPKGIMDSGDVFI